MYPWFYHNKNGVETMSGILGNKKLVITFILLCLVGVLFTIYYYNKSKQDEPIVYNEELSTPVDSTGRTILMVAVQEGDTEKTKEALKRGANPNDVDEFKQSAVFHSVIWDRPEHLKVLLEAGANPNVRRADGLTPLMFAALDNKLEHVKLLLDAGADVNAVDQSGHSAFLMATSKVIHKAGSSYDVLKMLIEAGADINYTNKLGHSAILHAYEDKDKEMISFLEKHGAILDQSKVHLVKIH